MSEATQYSNLSYCLLFALRLSEFRPIVLLDRNLFPARLMDAFLDHRIGANANLIAKVVHIKVVAAGC